MSEKCVLGKWLIEEPYALIGHVRFCEGLLRLEPLIAKQYMMKGCEKVETKSTRRIQWERYSEVGAKKIIFLIREELHEKQKNEF